MKAVSWHSLNICFQSACIQNDRPLREAAHAVLTFFRDQAISLVDEAHLTLDPLQQSIMTAGQKRPLPPDQLLLISRFYDYLLGYEGPPALAQLAGRLSTVFELRSIDTIRQLQGELVMLMCQDPLFAQVDQQALRAYWSQDSDERPAWLANDPKEDLIILARGFLHQLLPYILTLQRGKDFGYSIHPGDETAAPKHDGNPVQAHLSDPILVAALSTELYANDGVSDRLMARLIDDQKRLHQLQRQWQPVGQTDAEALFQRNLPADAPEVNFEQQDKTLKSYLLGQRSLRKQPDIVRECLKRYVYPQIKVPEYSLVSTPAALQYGFGRSILFTATPMDIRIYPWQLRAENSILSPAFEARVIWQMLQPENNRHCLLKTSADPRQFFSALREAAPDIFDDMTDLIDRGALLANSSNEAVVRAFLDEYELTTTEMQAAGLYFDKQMKAVSKKAEWGNLAIKGTRFAEALKRRGLKAETMLLFLFLDLSKTTGTDVKRPASDRAALTLGFQSMTETIQATMRKRQFLDPHGQQVMMLMFTNLYQQVYREMMKVDADNLEFDFQIVARWFIANEAERLPVRIVLAAWQGLTEIFKQQLWEDIYQGKKQVGPYLNKGILKQDYSLLAKHNYAIPRNPAETGAVLSAYVAHLEKVCDLHFAPGSEQARAIALIIERTGAAVAEIESPQSQNLGNESMQQQQAEQQTMAESQQQERNRTQQQANQGTAQLPLNRELYPPDLSLQSAFADKKRYQPLKLAQLPTCKTLAFRLNYQEMSPFILTAMQQDELVWLKPIEALLMVRHADGTIQSLALSTAGQEYFNYLLHFEGSDQAYAILGHDGRVLAHTAAWPYKTQAQVLQDPSCQNLLAFTQFLRGELSNPFHLAAVIKILGWSHDDFKQALYAIKTARVDKNPMQFPDEYPVLEQCCNWVDHGIRLTSPVPPAQGVAATGRFPGLTPSQDPWCQSVILIQPPQSPAYSFFNGQPISLQPNWVVLDGKQAPNLHQVKQVTDQLITLRKALVPQAHIGWGATLSGTAIKAARLDAIIALLSQSPHQFAHLDHEALINHPFTIQRTGSVLGRFRIHEKTISILKLVGREAIRGDAEVSPKRPD